MHTLQQDVRQIFVEDVLLNIIKMEEKLIAVSFKNLGEILPR